MLWFEIFIWCKGISILQQLCDAQCALHIPPILHQQSLIFHWSNICKALCSGSLHFYQIGCLLDVFQVDCGTIILIGLDFPCPRLLFSLFKIFRSCGGWERPVAKVDKSWFQFSGCSQIGQNLGLAKYDGDSSEILQCNSCMHCTMQKL